MDNTRRQLELWFNHHKIFERDEPELTDADRYDKNIWTNDEEEVHGNGSVEAINYVDGDLFSSFGHTFENQAYSHPIGWLPPQTNVNAEEKHAELAMFHCIANQVFGGPLPRAITNDFRDTALNSVRKMGSKIKRMTTTTEQPITGTSTSFNFDSDEIFSQALEHFQNTPLCHHPHLQMSYLDQQQLFFHPKVSKQMPQRVRRDHPTGKFLFENNIRKMNQPPLESTKEGIEEKWAALTRQEKLAWNELAEAAREERNLQVKLKYISNGKLMPRHPY